jgi:hypothetical protein
MSNSEISDKELGEVDVTLKGKKPRKKSQAFGVPKTAALKAM